MSANLQLLRLLQLVSANLPVGGFTYSQGLELSLIHISEPTRPY